MKLQSLAPMALVVAFLLASVGYSQTAPAPAAAVKIIRIKAGSNDPVKDSAGNIWEAESGFEGGDVVARDADLAIGNTKTPEVYRTEHYRMTSFTRALPNGKYTVKLHFAETYDEITDAGQRVFTVDVNGTEIKDLDIVKEAGGAKKALVKVVPVTITNGKLSITFTPKAQSTSINGIEIVPAAD